MTELDEELSTLEYCIRLSTILKPISIYPISLKLTKVGKKPEEDHPFETISEYEVIAVKLMNEKLGIGAMFSYWNVAL